MFVKPSLPHSIGEKEFVAMMAMGQALQALAIDTMLPAIGVMARDLGASDPNDRQLILGVFMVGIGLGALIPGALADRFGRRPVLLISLIIFVLSGLACALVQDFETLLALRLVQSIGSGALAVLPPAIIRDKYEGDRMARLQSVIGMVFMLVPMIAPTLGQGVLLFASWRWIFGLIGALGIVVTLWVWLRLPETLHPEHRQEILPKTILGNMGSVLMTRASIGYVLGSAMMMSAMWGFINSSQQLIAEHFGAGLMFPMIFGMLALSMSVSNFANSRIVERFGARRVSHAALFAYIAVASLQVMAAFSPHQTLWQFVALMGANMCLGGFIGANFGSIALQPFASMAGAAASVQTFVRMMAASVLGAMVGRAFDGTARPLALALLTAGVLTLLLVLFSEKGRLFRRLHYPAKAL